MKSPLLFGSALTLAACGCGFGDKADRGPDTGGDTGVGDLCEGPLDPATTESEVDCDQDGVADGSAIASGAVLDANSDGIPDACQLLEGSTQFGREDYVSYQAGSLPILLLAPHGGDLEPAEIPQREGASAPPDLYTLELAQAISDALVSRTGRRPHLVACHLHRYRLDCNRSMEVGAEDNVYAQQAWTEFHHFIEQAKSNAASVFGQGLLLDVHGMSRDTIEIGTLIQGSQWLESDSRLNHGAYAVSSSIRHLAAETNSGFAAISRGTLSLGASLADAGYDTIPSPLNPDPGVDSSGEVNAYYNGGYNTARHGSRSGGVIDAIQLEHPLAIRSSASAREAYAEVLADALLDFLVAMTEVEVEAEVGLRLEAIDHRLSETGNEGLLRIHRTGSLSEELEITLTATGSAVVEMDFLLEKKWTLPPGEARVDVLLQGLDDQELEGPESFSVRIQDKAGISVIGEKANFWIVDNEAPSVWVESLTPGLEEGGESTVVIARDYCDSTADVSIEFFGESEANDFLESAATEMGFQDQEATLAFSLSPQADGLMEGLEDLVLTVGGSDFASGPESSMTRWIQDEDLPERLNAWWPFTHSTSPLLDRVHLNEAILFPSESPPAIEQNPNESPTHWLALDGEADVMLIEKLPEQATGSLSIAFSFRARPGAERPYQYLWSQGNVGYRSSLNIYLTSSGWLRTGFRAEDDDWNYRALDVEEDLRDGEWHSYRLHVEWQAPLAQVYLDGTLMAEHALGSGAFSPNGHTYLGGRSDLEPARHFFGDLAGIQVYVGE
jgi:hypothetical protein